MDTIKQENYALLNDESDLEEYDKSDATKNKPNGCKNRETEFLPCVDNAAYLQRPANSYCVVMEPSNMSLAFNKKRINWLTLKMIVMRLSVSRNECPCLALCFLVLTNDVEMTAPKLEKEQMQNITSGVSDLHYHNIQSSLNELKLENASQLNEDLKMEHAKLEFQNVDPNLLKRVHLLETNIKSIRKVVSGQGEEIKTLLSNQQSQSVKHEKAWERQFNNMTTALNSLQNRLEEGLDVVFAQISQLRDDVYFIENHLNRTKQERFGVNETAPKPTRGITGQPLIEPLITVSQTTDITEKPQTTVQPVSKQDVNGEESYHVAVSFLKSRADFQVFFYGADKDADGYLTYNEIVNVLGDEAPSLDLLHRSDNDQDGKYSYTELIKTFFLEGICNTMLLQCALQFIVQGMEVNGEWFLQGWRRVDRLPIDSQQDSQ
ncbi:uncharacterized protein PAF06_014082 [Gastrophryne carolinensis]